MVSSIYDPLGIIAPKTIHAKMIFQDECKRRVGWDEQMEERNKGAWQQWLNDLPYLSQLSLPRCYRPKEFGPLETVQLHHFSDASERAYGCVAYLRLTGQDGTHHVSFVCGRARLAPLKWLTIPRLELCAAVLAANADKQLRSELQWSINKSVFWTNCTVVLHYINNAESPVPHGRESLLQKRPGEPTAAWPGEPAAKEAWRAHRGMAGRACCKRGLESPPRHGR